MHWVNSSSLLGIRQLVLIGATDLASDGRRVVSYKS